MLTVQSCKVAVPDIGTMWQRKTPFTEFRKKCPSTGIRSLRSGWETESQTLSSGPQKHSKLSIIAGLRNMDLSTPKLEDFAAWQWMELHRLKLRGTCTPHGQLEYWNKNLIDFVGLPFEEIVGLGFYRMFHPEDVERTRLSWDEVVATKQPKPVDARIRRFDGEYRWFNLRQNPLLDAQGEVVRWYGVVVDIEDRKRAEESLRQSQSDLAHVTRLTTIGELAVSIAHEVNQPLMAIVTNAGTCLRWLQPGQTDLEQARLAAERVVRDGHRAGDIVSSIRAMAQRSQTRMERTDINQALSDVLFLLHGELQSRGLQAITDLPPDPHYFIGDPTQVQQVLLNLIMNSAEATPRDEEGPIHVRCSQNANSEIEITVSDTGKGIPPELVDRVFDAFYTTKSDGIGMGLTICRSIVEAHGGRIWAATNQPRGTSFSFTLPLQGNNR